jgi:MFS family permease
MNRRRAWIYLFMLLLVTINYMDRSALAVAARSVASEYRLSPVEMGYLFSSFLWTYVLFLIPVGILIDRFGTKKVTAYGIGIWSLAIAVTGVAWSFTSLLAIRLVMGAGEATAIPSCGRITREWMPSRERGLASTIYSAGGFLGPAVGAVIVGPVSAAYGWRASFVLLGILGFVWLAASLIWFDRPERVRWLSAQEREKILAERGPTPEPSLEQGSARALLPLLRCRSIWGIAITQGAGVYSVYFLLFWMPSYLQSVRHLNIMQTGLFTAIPWLCGAPLSIALGVISDRMLSREQLLAGRRRIMVIIGTLLGALLLLVPFTENIVAILAIFALAVGGLMTVLALDGALTTDLVRSPRDVGKAYTLPVLSGNFFGLMAPIITGYVVQGFGSYDWAFVIAGVFLLIGALSSWTMTHRPIVTDAADLTGLGAAPAGLGRG